MIIVKTMEKNILNEDPLIVKELETYFKRGKEEYYEKFSANYKINSWVLQIIKELKICFTIKEHVHYKNLATEKNIQYDNYTPYSTSCFPDVSSTKKKYTKHELFLKNFAKSFSIVYELSRIEATRKNPDWSGFNFSSSCVFYNNLERYVFDIFLIKINDLVYRDCCEGSNVDDCDESLKDHLYGLEGI
jgi:hypothetical protein